ncbi:MAG: glucosaminidase domain-containing protein, partial [Bacteroidota bacterium]
MKQTQHPAPYDIRAYLMDKWHRLHQQLTSPWTKALVLIVLFMLVSRKELSLSLSINGSSWFGVNETAYIYDVEDNATGHAMNVSQLVSPIAAPKPKDWTAKQRRQLAYVAKYASIAQAEMEKNRVPASVTLAQGLLESNIGASTLATKNNNHF